MWTAGLRCLPLLWHCGHCGSPLVCSHLLLVSVGSLQAGEHNFPFQFLLPGEWKASGDLSLEMVGPAGRRCLPIPVLSVATAPTSFEGPFGKIVHQVKASIDTPRFSKDHKCSLVFYILSPLNLNTIPDIEVRMEQRLPSFIPFSLLKPGSQPLQAESLSPCHRNAFCVRFISSAPFSL